jgi:phosphoglycerate dehydrogenase-like enzyme
VAGTGAAASVVLSSLQSPPVSVAVWIRDRPQRRALGPMPASVDLHLIPHDGELPREIRNAEFLVPPFGAQALLEMLGDMPRLAVVQAASAGTEWLAPWIPDGVKLCSARGTRDTAVAEWALAAILAMEKQLRELSLMQSEHAWRARMLGELAGRHALIVGYGSIGQRVANMLRALGVIVDGVASTARDDIHAVEELARLLPSADIVVLLVPLTPQTRGLFDAGMLSRMRRGALLVNAARGAIVDTESLVAHLRSGSLRAALDVTDPEPLPSNHPLWRAPGVMITPHLAGDSPEAEERVYRFIGEQIRRYVSGQPLFNRVDS